MSIQQLIEGRAQRTDAQPIPAPESVRPPGEPYYATSAELQSVGGRYRDVQYLDTPQVDGTISTAREVPEEVSISAAEQARRDEIARQVEYSLKKFHAQIETDPHFKREIDTLIGRKMRSNAYKGFHYQGSFSFELGETTASEDLNYVISPVTVTLQLFNIGENKHVSATFSCMSYATAEGDDQPWKYALREDTKLNIKGQDIVSRLKQKAINLWQGNKRLNDRF